MKGLLTLFSLFAAVLPECAAFARQIERIDTIESARISATKPPFASTGLKRLNAGDLLETAAVFGTPDVVKILQNLPGVSSGMELMSGLYVHGGDGGDNLFLLDGVPLYQVSHLAGLFSSFNTDIIESLDFYKSGFSARFGGKLSSVVDVKIRDGSMHDFGGSVSIGLIDGRVMLNGPIIKDKLSYSLALRRSWLEALLIPVIAISNLGDRYKTDGTYALFDTNLNLCYASSPRDKINLRFFSSSDRAGYGRSITEKYYGKEIYSLTRDERLRMKWGNLAASFDWNHALSKVSGITSSAYYSRGYSDIYTFERADEVRDETVIPNSYMEKTLGSANLAGIRNNYFLSQTHHNISAGVQYQHSWYAPSCYFEKRVENESQPSRSIPRIYKSDEISFFLEDEIIYGPFSLTAGLRVDAYFSNGQTYFRPQPRLSASYNVGKDIIVKASYEAMSQYSHLLSSLYIDLPSNLWMPSTKIIKPSDSHQAAAGMFVRISKHLHIDISGYYRSMGNCLIYSGSSSIFPPIDRWEEEFTCGMGHSYGSDLEMKYLAERFRIIAYYTLSWSERLFPELYPAWFRDRFDNRHKLTLSGLYKVSGHIDLNATWNYHSGNRVSLPEHVVDEGDGGYSFLFAEPYNAKMPDYHRLDLNCNIHKKTKRGNESVWSISIYNAYCRMNPIMMRNTRNEKGEPVAKVYSYVPIIPSFSYTYKF